MDVDCISDSDQDTRSTPSQTGSGRWRSRSGRVGVLLKLQPLSHANATSAAVLPVASSPSRRSRKLKPTWDANAETQHCGGSSSDDVIILSDSSPEILAKTVKATGRVKASYLDRRYEESQRFEIDDSSDDEHISPASSTNRGVGMQPEGDIVRIPTEVSGLSKMSSSASRLKHRRSHDGCRHTPQGNTVQYSTDMSNKLGGARTVEPVKNAARSATTSRGLYGNGDRKSTDGQRVLRPDTCRGQALSSSVTSSSCARKTVSRRVLKKHRRPQVWSDNSDSDFEQSQYTPKVTTTRLKTNVACKPPEVSREEMSGSPQGGGQSDSSASSSLLSPVKTLTTVGRRPIVQTEFSNSSSSDSESLLSPNKTLTPVGIRTLAGKHNTPVTSSKMPLKNSFKNRQQLFSGTGESTEPDVADDLKLGRPSRLGRKSLVSNTNLQDKVRDSNESSTSGPSFLTIAGKRKASYEVDAAVSHDVCDSPLTSPVKRRRCSESLFTEDDQSDPAGGDTEPYNFRGPMGLADKTGCSNKFQLESHPQVVLHDMFSCTSLDPEAQTFIKHQQVSERVVDSVAEYPGGRVARVQPPRSVVEAGRRPSASPPTHGVTSANHGPNEDHRTGNCRPTNVSSTLNPRNSDRLSAGPSNTKGGNALTRASRVRESNDPVAGCQISNDSPSSDSDIPLTQLHLHVSSTKKPVGHTVKDPSLALRVHRDAARETEPVNISDTSPEDKRSSPEPHALDDGGSMRAASPVPTTSKIASLADYTQAVESQRSDLMDPDLINDLISLINSDEDDFVDVCSVPAVTRQSNLNVAPSPSKATTLPPRALLFAGCNDRGATNPAAASASREPIVSASAADGTSRNAVSESDHCCNDLTPPVASRLICVEASSSDLQSGEGNVLRGTRTEAFNDPDTSGAATGQPGVRDEGSVAGVDLIGKPEEPQEDRMEYTQSVLDYSQTDDVVWLSEDDDDEMIFGHLTQAAVKLEPRDSDQDEDVSDDAEDLFDLTIDDDWTPTIIDKIDRTFADDQDDLASPAHIKVETEDTFADPGYLGQLTQAFDVPFEDPERESEEQAPATKPLFTSSLRQERTSDCLRPKVGPVSRDRPTEWGDGRGDPSGLSMECKRDPHGRGDDHPAPQVGAGDVTRQTQTLNQSSMALATVSHIPPDRQHDGEPSMPSNAESGISKKADVTVVSPTAGGAKEPVVIPCISQAGVPIASAIHIAEVLPCSDDLSFDGELAVDEPVRLGPEVNTVPDDQLEEYLSNKFCGTPCKTDVNERGLLESDHHPEATIVISPTDGQNLNDVSPDVRSKVRSKMLKLSSSKRKTDRTGPSTLVSTHLEQVAQGVKSREGKAKTIAVDTPIEPQPIARIPEPEAWISSIHARSEDAEGKSSLVSGESSAKHHQARGLPRVTERRKPRVDHVSKATGLRDKKSGRKGALATTALQRGRKGESTKRASKNIGSPVRFDSAIGRAKEQLLIREKLLKEREGQGIQEARGTEAAPQCDVSSSPGCAPSALKADKLRRVVASVKAQPHKAAKLIDALELKPKRGSTKDKIPKDKIDERKGTPKVKVAASEGRAQGHNITQRVRSKSVTSEVGASGAKGRCETGAKGGTKVHEPAKQAHKSQSTLTGGPDSHKSDGHIDKARRHSESKSSHKSHDKPPTTKGTSGSKSARAVNKAAVPERPERSSAGKRQDANTTAGGRPQRSSRSKDDVRAGTRAKPITDKSDAPNTARVVPAGDIFHMLKIPRMQPETAAEEKNTTDLPSGTVHGGSGSAFPNPRPAPLIKLKAVTTTAEEERTPDTLLRNILKWSPLWFEEHERIQTAPPLVEAGTMFPLLETYDNFDDYEKILRPHLVMELWEQVYRSWLEKKKKGQLHKLQLRPTYLDTGVTSCGKQRVFMDLQCQGVIPKAQADRGFYPKETDLLRVDLPIQPPGQPPQPPGQPPQPQMRPVQGYVLKSRIFYKAHNGIHQDVAKLMKPALVILHAEIRLSYRQMRINEKSFMEVSVLDNIVSSLRQYSGVLALPSSLLARDILRPINVKVFVPHDETIDADLGKRYNPPQARAIATISSSVLLPFGSPKLFLLQGPPGTGKSHTITGLIERIVQRGATLQSRPRILLCAPSNGAIDELTRRLINLQRTQYQKKERPIKLIRFGNAFSMHTSVQDFALDKVYERQAETYLQRCCEQGPASVRRALTDINNKLDDTSRTYERLKKEGKVQEARLLERELENLNKQRQRFTGKGKSSLNPREEAKLKQELLMSCDVICSTLNGSGSHRLLGLLKAEPQDRVFSCVIVDEACQCIELDTLIPLQYNADKLVLVGDPEQLPPTVISQKATEMNFGQSLFERLFAFFRGKALNPVQMLQIQYRMHPDICRFPSTHVYQGQLRTDTETAAKRSLFKLRHHLVFDVQYGLEEQEAPGLICNKAEADLTVQLCCFLIRRDRALRPVNIGVITPYQKQRSVLLDRLAASRLTEVEVGTVDGFQGREKDVIIFSCVRAQKGKANIGFLADRRRMNVALTRARYGLYIVGHVHTLQVDEHWRALTEHARATHALIAVPSARDAAAILDKFCAKSAS